MIRNYSSMKMMFSKKSKTRTNSAMNEHLSTQLKQIYDSYVQSKETNVNLLGSSNEHIFEPTKDSQFKDHYPVFYKKIIELIWENNKEKETLGVDFNKKSTPFLVGDMTFGLGNTSNEILKEFTNSNVFAADIDKKMISLASEKKELENFIFEDRLKLYHTSYTEFDLVFNDSKKLRYKTKSLSSKSYFSKFGDDKQLDYAILDLGFNSMQLLPEDGRGFSFKALSNELDMRYDMSNSNNATASEILNNSSKLELIEIFKNYAEEKYAEPLVDNILKQRETKRFSTVQDFVDVIDLTFSRKIQFKDKYDLYTRLFQAIRIAVNYELLNVKRGLALVPDMMEKHGMLFVISFHSLEDKLVRKMMTHYDKLSLGVQFSKKITPTDDEISENPRSKSAILRVFRFN